MNPLSSSAGLVVNFLGYIAKQTMADKGRNGSSRCKTESVPAVETRQRFGHGDGRLEVRFFFLHFLT